MAMALCVASNPWRAGAAAKMKVVRPHYRGSSRYGARFKAAAGHRPTRKCNARGGTGAGASSCFWAHWPTVGEKLTTASAAPLVLLFVPQIWKNWSSMSTGRAVLLQELPFTGYLFGIGGNLLLLSYFTERKERAACVNQTIGVCSSFVVVAQIYEAGFMPGPIFTGVAIHVMAGLLLPLLNWAGRVPGSSSVWRAWERLIVLAGASVVSFLAVSIVTDMPTFSATAIASITALVLGFTAARAILPFLRADSPRRRRNETQPSAFAVVYGWMATILFMIMPLPQLLRNLCAAAAAGSSAVSRQTVFLAIIGNGLMIPRALAVEDRLWLVGSCWGMLVMGVLQLFSMSCSEPRHTLETRLVAIGAAAFLLAAAYCQRQYKGTIQKSASQ